MQNRLWLCSLSHLRFCGMTLPVLKADPVGHYLEMLYEPKTVYFTYAKVVKLHFFIILCNLDFYLFSKFLFSPN